jgi:hypothetical protein
VEDGGGSSSTRVKGDGDSDETVPETTGLVVPMECGRQSERRYSEEGLSLVVVVRFEARIRRRAISLGAGRGALFLSQLALLALVEQMNSARYGTSIFGSLV